MGVWEEYEDALRELEQADWAFRLALERYFPVRNYVEGQQIRVGRPLEGAQEALHAAEGRRDQAKERLYEIVDKLVGA